MTNECNILIYSVFIFFCYSFIILNMALPLFHNIISFINALGYSGILLGPVIIGFIGKRYGLHVSFIGIAVFALIVAIISYMILRIRHIPIQTDVQEDDRKTCLCNSAK